MNRIQNVSTFFLLIFKTLLLFLPTVALLKWIFMNHHFMHHPFAQNILLKPFNAPEGLVNLADIAWTPLTQIVGLASYLLALVPILISLYALIHIFKKYQRGEIFNIMNAKYYRLIGWMFIANAFITKPLSECLMTVAVTLNNEPGHRYITLGFGSPNLEAIFCGAVIIVISWVMLEASKLHDEQKHTI